MEFIIFFLMLIVPGIIADRIYHLVAQGSETSNIFTALIFSFIITVINITGLFIFKDILTLPELEESLECLQFMRRFALLSTLSATILGVVGGVIRRLFFWISN